MDAQVSGLLSRGALGTAKATSVEGRYLSHLERDLLAMLRKPTAVQKLLIANLAQLSWRQREMERSMQPPNPAPSIEQLRIYHRLHDLSLGTYRELFPRAPAGRAPGDPEVVADALRAIRAEAQDAPA